MIFINWTKILLWTLVLLQIFLIGFIWVIGQQNTVDVISSNVYPVNFLHHGKNSSSAKHTLAGTIPPINEYLTVSNVSCFKDGLTDSKTIELVGDDGDCVCKPDWHGPACDQPEVVWRAIIKTKNYHHSPSDPPRPRKVIYVISGYFVNANLLELQIYNVLGLVDYVVICQIGNGTKIPLPATQKGVRVFLHQRHCSPRQVLVHFKNHMNLESTSLILYSKDDEIVNRKSLAYFKSFYQPQFGVISFRLKHNVYGFYWQHPGQTKTSGYLTSIDNLKRLFNPPNLIVGDLNHYGGWCCEYCLEPAQIIQEMHIRFGDQLENVRFDKNGQIDLSFVENMITRGVYADGVTKLLKLNMNYDRYFATDYALNNTWKFTNLLVNSFLNYKNDDVVDDEFY